MIAIVVVDEEMGIGKDGQLLTYISGDLKYFKEKTVGKTIVFGRKTMDTFPNKKPLPNRRSIVLTSDENYECECEKVGSIDEFFEIAKEIPKDELLVAGGASVYKQLLPYCDKLLLTRIYRKFGADAFFPEVSEREWSEVRASDLHEENGIQYRFFEYERVR